MIKVVTDRLGMTTPEVWIESVVAPALDDYLADKKAYHKAVCAAMLAHHVSDRVFHYYDEHNPSMLQGADSEGQFLSDVIEAEQCLALELVRDVANASKHHFLKLDRRETWVNTATDAASLTPHGYSIGDTGYSIEQAVREVIQFWRDWREKHPISGIDDA